MSHWLFHPLELAFCGYSGSGKTTLLKKLVKRMSCSYRISYIKHDAHHFSMDYEGKDTDVLKKAGASTVFIHNSEHSALLVDGQQAEYQIRQQFLNDDFVLVEGHKMSRMPKIVLLDDDHQLWREWQAGKLHEVIAFVGQGTTAERDLGSLPLFDRNDIESIAQFIENYFMTILAKIPLKAAVMIGGKSSRMGQDKSQIAYHGVAQVDYMYNMLTELCEEVVISCNQQQYKSMRLQGSLTDKKVVVDLFTEKGPVGGILSLFTFYPDTFWLVVGCDMPNLQLPELRHLVEQHNPYKMLTAFKRATNKFIEPLCAIYGPKSVMALFNSMWSGRGGITKLFPTHSVMSVTPIKDSSLININNPDEIKLFSSTKET